MPECLLKFPLVLACCLAFLHPPALAEEPAAPKQALSPEQFYETRIQPLLATHCVDCHGADTQESELRLDTLDGIGRGGKSGPLFVPGKVDQSLLLSAVRYDDEALQMPPDGKLPQEAIAAFEEWAALGLPASATADADAAPHSAIDLTEAREFWAFQPVVRPPLPEVARPEWIKTPVDAFILHRLEQEKLTPAEPANRRTLIRRATLDLTGLPPAPEEVEAFVNDDSPQAYETVIDRLLSSPDYGERWGRHWLDVVRYADSNGLDENIAHGNAWRYRDYVIASLNHDRPYDEFLQQQVAGDLLAKDEPDVQRKHDCLIATGFLTLGPKVLAEGDEVKMQMDIVDEQIDTIGRAFLGLTLGCARCHDHKFDPISTADYYALAGIFKSTKTMESLKRIARWNENVIASAEELAAKAAHDALIAAQQAEIAKAVEAANSELLKTEEKLPEKPETKYPAETKESLAALREQLKQLEAAAPVLPTAMGVVEGDAANVPIHVRGSHRSLGRMVSRGMPVVLRADEPRPIAADQSGRKQFADWLVDPDNPLTARVMVNRVWRWHFGRGLVATTDNFGLLGERPLHPELLDWLAAELVSSGWSLKSLHRTIMLSSTYCMSSRPGAAQAIDPDNLLWSRNNVRRLEAEAIRDSLLLVSGRLDRTRGGSLLHVKNREFLFDHTSKDNTKYDTPRRSVYLPIIRNNLYDQFSLFDYTDAAVPNGNRDSSTIAPQALFLMNSDLLLKSSAALAERIAREFPADPAARVGRLYALAYGRPPSAAESERVLEAIRQFVELDAASDPPVGGVVDAEQEAWSAVCQMVLASNEFLYVE